MPRTIVIVVALVALFAANGVCRAEPPSQLAGIRLGDKVGDYADRLDMAKAVPVWDKPYLTRVNVKPTKGFKGGYVLFGNCAAPGRIVRIKFKYRGKDMKFFKARLAALVKRCGEPKVLHPDADGYQGRRWLFGPQKSLAVALLLERYEGDGLDVTQGNSIRLTNNVFLGEERACWEAKHKNDPEVQPAFPLFEIDDNWLLPQ